MAISIDSDGYAKLGYDLRRKLDQYITDRLSVEQQWLKNLRQYRGKYDPEQNIPTDRSQIYPKDTRVKVKGFVAKLMELMFPATENNWELVPTPIPSINHDDLQALISALEEMEFLQAQEEQRPPQPLTSNQIERAVNEFAKERARSMEKEILDQLADPRVDYPTLCKRVLRSGAIYGIGILKCPIVRTQTERVWEPDPQTGQYIAVEKKVRRPYPEFVKVWDIYPDLSARTWDEQEGIFERMVLNRHQFRKLAERPKFIKEAISKYLSEHSVGNYKSQSYETELQVLNNQSQQPSTDGRKYEVYRWYGYRSAHDLKNAGIEVKDEDLDKEVLTEMWMIDNTPIMAALAPFGDKPSDVYHAYIYSEDEDSNLMGVGMPEDLRDSQLGICAATRALYDNMAATAGPMLEVAVDLMKRGSDYKSIQSFKVFEREGEGQELANQAIRPIVHPSHMADILSIIRETRTQFDVESNIPSWTMGQTSQLGEAFRTSRNMSMLTGGANIIPKDAVRAFDTFTTSVIGSFVSWNMDFNPKPEIKGDYQVQAKGNLSLVAKEVRGAALDQFIMTATPEEKALLKTRTMLLERLRVRDLPTDILVDEEEAEEILEGMRQAQAQAQQLAQAEQMAKTGKLQADTQKSQAQAQSEAAMIQPMVLEALGRVENMERTAKVQEDKQQLETVRAALEAILAQSEDTGVPAKQGGKTK